MTGDLLLCQGPDQGHIDAHGNAIPPQALVYSLSFLPNIAMGQIIKQLIFYNF